MKLIICITVLTLMSYFSVLAQTGDDEVIFTKKLQLSDKAFHNLEIKTDGVFLDGKNKGNLKEIYSEIGFGSAYFISETYSYWELEDFSGYWLLFGTSTASGMCGMPTYAMIYVEGKGNIRVSKQSPQVCIGDFPIKIEFNLSFDKQCNTRPVWKISNSLEFDGCTFAWKEIKPKTIVKTRKK
jgi:hypothetical protein